MPTQCSDQTEPSTNGEHLLSAEFFRNLKIKTLFKSMSYDGNPGLSTWEIIDSIRHRGRRCEITRERLHCRKDREEVGGRKCLWAAGRPRRPTLRTRLKSAYRSCALLQSSDRFYQVGCIDFSKFQAQVELKNAVVNLALNLFQSHMLRSHILGLKQGTGKGIYLM